jgi:hypothetical protein
LLGRLARLLETPEFNEKGLDEGALGLSFGLPRAPMPCGELCVDFGIPSGFHISAIVEIKQGLQECPSDE